MNRSQSTSLWALCLFSVCWTTTVSSVENSSGFGYELLLAKLDYLEYKFLELQVETKEQGELLLENQSKIKRELLEQTSEILEQQKIFTNHEKIMNAIFELNPRKHPSDNSKLLPVLLNGKTLGIPSTVKSCAEMKSKQSGRYWLTVSDSINFEVYCEQTLHGGGWIVIQNRFNGSVDFFRNWTNYRNGFGNLDGEFWLGLEKIHQLTSTRSCELLVHLEDHAGAVKHAKYAKFAIGNESEKYSLKTLDSYSGTSGDALDNHKGMSFSTHDVDNDKSTLNCASVLHGGWWYNNCFSSNLNGAYQNKIDQATMNWYKFNNNDQGLKVSKMMVREI